MGRLSVTVAVHCIYMPVLAEFRQAQRIIFPFAHLAVNKQECRLIVLDLAVVDHISVRKRNLLFNNSCFFHGFLVLIVPMHVFIPVD